MHIAVVAVEGAVCTFQIVFLLHTRLPHNLFAYSLGVAFNLQICTGEGTATQFVGECELRGGYGDFFARHLKGMLHCGVVAFYCHKTFVVDKLAVRGIFHSHCGFVHQCEAHGLVAVNHFGMGFCACGCQQCQCGQYSCFCFHRAVVYVNAVH